MNYTTVLNLEVLSVYKEGDEPSTLNLGVLEGRHHQAELATFALKLWLNGPHVGPGTYRNIDAPLWWFSGDLEPEMQLWSMLRRFSKLGGLAFSVTPDDLSHLGFTATHDSAEDDGGTKSSEISSSKREFSDSIPSYKDENFELTTTQRELAAFGKWYKLRVQKRYGDVETSRWENYLRRQSKQK